MPPPMVLCHRTVEGKPTDSAAFLMSWLRERPFVDDSRRDVPPAVRTRARLVARFTDAW